MFVFPDMNNSFNMYTTIVEEFVRSGHNVFVIAPASLGEKTRVNVEKGIKVLRVKTLPLKNIPVWMKGVSNLLLPWQFKRAYERYGQNTNYNLIIISTPPVTLAGLASKLKKKYQARVYLMLRDIFPQNAVDLGFMRMGSMIYRYFRSTEQKLYSTADRIGCMSRANVEYITANNPEISKTKLHVLENFQIPYVIDNLKAPELIKRYRLENKYVVVFGGNMGRPQQMENVLHLAKQCSEFPDVIFILLGEGIMTGKMREEVYKRNILNIRLLDVLPKTEYQDLLSVCDVGLISLHEKFSVPNIPSKSLDYFNVGLPVLASIDKSTDYGMLLDEAGAGLWSYAGDHDGFKRNFDILYRDTSLRKKMGANGRAYFMKHLTPDIAYNTIISSLN